MSAAILMVDDEPHVRIIASQFFEMAGQKVLAAADGTEALQISKDVPLRAIILDANLGGEGSAPVLAALKQTHPKTPVIIYTGRDGEDEVVQSLLKKGADSYVMKDGSIQTLVQAVANLPAT